MLEFKKSNRKNKKYMVYYNGKWIHFGSIINQQYRDSTPLKLYSSFSLLKETINLVSAKL